MKRLSPNKSPNLQRFLNERAEKTVGKVMDLSKMSPKTLQQMIEMLSSYIQKPQDTRFLCIHLKGVNYHNDSMSRRLLAPYPQAVIKMLLAWIHQIIEGQSTVEVYMLECAPAYRHLRGRPLRELLVKSMINTLAPYYDAYRPPTLWEKVKKWILAL